LWRVFQRATVTGGAWVHAPPSLAARGFTRRQESSRPKLASSPLLFCNGGDTHRHLQNKKNTKHNNKPPLFILVFFSSASYKSGFLDFDFYSVSSRRQGRGHGPEGCHCWRREERLRVLLLPLGAVQPVVKEIGCCCWWPVCGLC